jgi:hypothetical protein
MKAADEARRIRLAGSAIDETPTSPPSGMPDPTTGTTSSASVYTSADALADFYDGDRMRILIAAVFCGLAVLNPMWFKHGFHEEY